MRIYNLLRGLAKVHRVSLLSFSDRAGLDEANPEMRALCERVYTVTWRPYRPASLLARLGYFSAKPRSFVDTASVEMEEHIESVLEALDDPLIIASGLEMAGYAPVFRGAPALLDELQLGVLYEQYAREKSPRRRLRHWLTWTKFRRYTATLLEKFRGCTVVSPREMELFTRAFPGYSDVHLIPNGIDLADYANVQAMPDPLKLVFSGSFAYEPNYEAMRWFIERVFPTVRQAVPGVRLVITGDTSGKRFPNMDGVTLTGYIEDVKPVIASAQISLAPLLTGGGTRLKILEAMALRTPVVATSKGAEGIDVTPGVDILIANSPEHFAEAVIRLLREPALRQQIAHFGYDLVARAYDWRRLMPAFLEMVETAATREIPVPQYANR